MESEKETSEACNQQEEGEKASAEDEEKGPIEDDAGCPEAGKLEGKEGIEEAKQEDEKEVENEEMKEASRDAGKDEEVKEQEVEEEEEEEEKGDAEEVVEGKSGGEEDEGEEREERGTEKNSVATKSRKKRTSATAELLSPRTPGSERPTRERKTVERFTLNESARSSTPKPVAIEKGRGTQLKDIPNVAFKLSKRKADENLHLLHTILFGKKAKVHNLKKNIGLFSGFVWAENEGKQRAKLKEKLDKCVKEKLIDFCDFLNIPVNKATVKKDELLVKLLEFLESPHATSDMLLADKEKGKKRKSNDPTIKSPSSSNLAGEKYTKKQKSDSESGKKRKHSTEEENNDKSESLQSEDDQDDDNKVPQVGSDNKEMDSGEETGEEQGAPETPMVQTSSLKRSAKKGTSTAVEKSAGKTSPANASNTTAKSIKKSSSSISKKGAAAESTSKQKVTSTKKQKAEKKSEVERSTPVKAKAARKSSSKVLKKDEGEGKSSKKAKEEPTREEMHAIVVNILKEVDFNTATLSDILKQLGNHFGLDLLHRKSEVKDIITEVIKSMPDDEDEEASESGESGEDADDGEA